MPFQACGFRVAWLSLRYALIPMFANLIYQVVTPSQGPAQRNEGNDLEIGDGARVRQQ